jgi:uncharacterized protein (DUF2384 family)
MGNLRDEQKRLETENAPRDVISEHDAYFLWGLSRMAIPYIGPMVSKGPRDAGADFQRPPSALEAKIHSVGTDLERTTSQIEAGWLAIAGYQAFERKHKELEVSWIQTHLPKNDIESARELATEVFGDEDLGKSWLLEPNLATDDRPPLSLLGTTGGLERVRNLLLRIQYGVLA